MILDKILGCRHHHWKDTDVTEVIEVDSRFALKRVTPSNPEHPDHEDYKKLSKHPNATTAHIKTDDIKVKRYSLKYSVKRKCKHQKCSKTDKKKMFETFKDKDEFTNRLLEVME